MSFSIRRPKYKD